MEFQHKWSNFEFFKSMEVSPLQTLQNTPDFQLSDHDIDALSAEKTLICGSSPGSDVPNCKRCGKIEISPFRLNFSPSASSSNPLQHESKLLISPNAYNITDMLIGTSVQDVRNLDSRNITKQRNLPSIALEVVNLGSPMEVCFTPTDCASSQLDSIAEPSTVCTPKPSRPIKKVPFQDVPASSMESDFRGLLDLKQNSLMEKEDFSQLFRESSDLDYQTHYEYVELLGRGSFGEVWSVRHQR
jgi:hypothetical protein